VQEPLDSGYVGTRYIDRHTMGTPILKKHGDGGRAAALFRLRNKRYLEKKAAILRCSSRPHAGQPNDQDETVKRFHATPSELG